MQDTTDRATRRAAITPPDPAELLAARIRAAAADLTEHALAGVWPMGRLMAYEALEKVEAIAAAAGVELPPRPPQLGQPSGVELRADWITEEDPR